MFSTAWTTSERAYGVVVERSVKIPMSDGIELDADIFRPDAAGPFPAILGYHPYNQASQTAPIKPAALSINIFRHANQEEGTAYIEAGDPAFYVRRGYAYLIANIRGTGNSGGIYPFLARREIEDGCELIEWMARQPWCNGQVGMFGVSYFAWIQFFIASLNPPHLKCIFAPWGATDLYRDSVYHGGILGHGFWRMWAYGSLYKARVASETRQRLGEEAFGQAIAACLRDEDITRVPELAAILRNPEQGMNPLLVDLLLNPCDGPYWEERRVNYPTINVPAYLGACWGIYGLHLPGAFRSWENLSVPKKLVIGPPAYLDRPLYQLQYESLRWFDFWLKGIETGILQEPPIRLFIPGEGTWKEANEWPLPETKWTPFHLHEGGVLFEREHWPNEGTTSFEDSPWGRGSLEFSTPLFVEQTEVIGPIVLKLFASSTAPEALWFISLRAVDAAGQERILTRGWLRGSHRRLDPQRSKPWAPFFPHTQPEPLTPGEVTEFTIPLVPTCTLCKPGSRLVLKISCTDDPPKHPLEALASGHLHRASASRITVHHNAEHPSHLLLPITRGNVMGTFISGGKPYL
ncbi:MAG: CocE/NonD family hydrolase [Candidatus Tectomicrobia bacterium]|nr:CocE/NonD family hydrolase [Candidatus Tectomicrobia bacterium]